MEKNKKVRHCTQCDFTSNSGTGIAAHMRHRHGISDYRAELDRAAKGETGLNESKPTPGAQPATEALQHITAVMQSNEPVQMAQWFEDAISDHLAWVEWLKQGRKLFDMALRGERLANGAKNS